MDDAQAAKLRALAERAREAMAKYRTDPSYPTGAAMVDDWINVAPLYNDAPDTILALLDERDALRRERDYMVAKAAEKSLGGYRELGARAAAAENERDAAMALLKKHGIDYEP